MERLFPRTRKTSGVNPGTEGMTLMIGVNKKTAAYYHVCKVFDEYAASLTAACRQGCADCCTINVSLTSLEGFLIVEWLERSGRMDVLSPLRGQADRQRFIPRFTLNQAAESLARGEAVPEETIDPAWGACPLLNENRCPIYAVRPFACRCMISEMQCREEGSALMAPLTVAVGHVMMQYIEHIDTGGFTGNLTDVLLFMQSSDNRRRYREGEPWLGGAPFVPHRSARHLLVDPRHGRALEPILAALNAGG